MDLGQARVLLRVAPRRGVTVDDEQSSTQCREQDKKKRERQRFKTGLTIPSRNEVEEEVKQVRIAPLVLQQSELFALVTHVSIMFILNDVIHL